MADIEIIKADWNSYKTDIKTIRTEVFIKEQLVDEELEWDQHDQTALHYLAFYNNRAVATARLQTDGQIGRMAVLKEFRYQGIGSKLLEKLLNDKIITQDKIITRDKLFIHAQTHAMAFYQRLGFINQGSEFLEAGIPHYKMTLN